MTRILLGLSLVFFLAVPSLAADRNIDVSGKEVPAGFVDERRIALVVGNSNYLAVASLRNPVNDARDIAAALKGLGFEVTLNLDASQKAMHRAIINFGRSLKDGGVGLFYYAGHGVQEGGTNWMIPVDAEIDAPELIEAEAVGMNKVLERMRVAKNRLNIVILDACRDNPFAEHYDTTETRSLGEKTRGLTQMRAPSGTYIAYATAPGGVAADGEGRNSTFTRALLDAIDDPGQKLEDVFKNVRAKVLDATDRAQVPWTSSSITGDFYFKPLSNVAEEKEREGEAKGEAPRADSGERDLWRDAKELNSVAAYDDFLQRFPDGLFAGQARLRMGGLKQASAEEIKQASLSEPEFTILPPDQQMSAVRSANVRSGPGTSHDRLLTLGRGDEVDVTGRAEDGEWYRIALAGGRVGYVFKNLLEEKRAGPSVGDTFRDCAECPELVVVPAGSFMMGSDRGERDWYLAQGGTQEFVDRETPRHRVSVGTAFAIGKYEVTKGQFAAFVRKSGRKVTGGCWHYGGEWKKEVSHSWREPGFEQGDDEPVLCVNYEDAKAYTAWLSRETSHAYRLPSEAEWEYAARAGTTTARYWGEDADNDRGCDYANAADESGAPEHNLARKKTNIFMCRDGYVYTSPVGSFSPNPFGLYDMLGNVWEWTEDCWNESYAGAPSDTNVWKAGNCGRRVLRGGSWSASPRVVRSAYRSRSDFENRLYDSGFRIARTLP